MARRKEPRIPYAILHQLLAGSDVRTAFGQGGLHDELKKAFARRVLNAEMDYPWLAGVGASLPKQPRCFATCTTCATYWHSVLGKVSVHRSVSISLIPELQAVAEDLLAMGR